MENTMRPTVILTGEDGNALRVLAACRRAAKDAGWSDSDWARVRNEMIDGDYDHLLATAQEYFHVE
jgi:hypothetical protein